MFRWVFHTAEELGGSAQQGRLAVYHGGGYKQDLIGGNISALELINELRENKWLDRGTRVVFIDFSLYNANLNLFCIVRLVLDFVALCMCYFKKSSVLNAYDSELLMFTSNMQCNYIALQYITSHRVFGACPKPG